jgi:hypothetical protein
LNNLTINKTNVKCCEKGNQALHYLHKRKEFMIMYEGEEWWIIVDFCPWCGVKLDTWHVDYDKTERFEKV